MTDYLIIDGMNVFMRHFAANPAISENGESIGGVVGFLRGLKNLINGLYPKEVIVVWEGGGSPRRRAIDPNYKQSRRPVKLNRFYEEIPATASGRNQQINMLIQLLRFGPIKQLYVSDCEADDVIGYLTNFELRNKKIVIASSDHDYYQLVNDNITIWSPGQKKIVTQEDIFKKFNIHPENFCAARCFCGDKSDGVPGASGVGFKSITKRFKFLSTGEKSSVDDIITFAEQNVLQSKLKIYKNIVNHATRAKINWKLMYLGTNNLSASQIRKIEFQIEQQPPSSKKLDFMRALKRYQINNFDVNSYFMALNFINNK